VFADARACTSANTGSLGTGDAPRDAPESEPLPPPPPSSARARPPFFFRFFFPPAASTAGGAPARAGASWIAMARGVGVRVCWVARAAIAFARSRLEGPEEFSCARSVVLLGYDVGSGGGGGGGVVNDDDASSGGSGGGGERRACLAREGQVERTRVTALDRHITLALHSTYVLSPAIHPEVPHRLCMTGAGDDVIRLCQCFAGGACSRECAWRG
jgi:hypothetical protein